MKETIFFSKVPLIRFPQLLSLIWPVLNYSSVSAENFCSVCGRMTSTFSERSCTKILSNTCVASCDSKLGSQEKL
jgi:hypothetical protein